MGILADPFLAIRRAVWALAPALGFVFPAVVGAAEPWANDPAVQEVLELRRQGIAAMTSVGASAASERYSSTFVANTPGNAVVKGEQGGEWRHDLRHANVVSIE